MIRRPPRSTQSRSSAASDVYKRQAHGLHLPLPRTEHRPEPPFPDRVLPFPLSVLPQMEESPVLYRGPRYHPASSSSGLATHLPRRPPVAGHESRDARPIGSLWTAAPLAYPGVFLKGPFITRRLFILTFIGDLISLRKCSPNERYGVKDVRSTARPTRKRGDAPDLPGCLLYTSPSPRD